MVEDILVNLTNYIGAVFIGMCILAHAFISRHTEMNKQRVVLQVPSNSPTPQNIKSVLPLQPIEPEVCKWCGEIITKQEQYTMARNGEPHCNYEQDQQVRVRKQVSKPQSPSNIDARTGRFVVTPKPQRINTKQDIEEDNNEQ